MKTKDIVALLKEGKRPMVRLMKNLWEDGWGEAGMLARVVGFREHPGDSEEMVELMFDYNENKAHNLALQGRNYYLKDGGLGTAFESGMMKEDEGISEDVFFELPQDVPVELADSPVLEEYVKSGSKVPYVEWLEGELARTRSVYKDCLGVE